MKILILGATGQIGYALTEALAKTRHRVSVLVRDASRLKFPEKVDVIERREFTQEAFASALEGVDHVIYGIGPPEQFTFDKSIFDKVNCQLLETFLDAMKASSARRLTYMSTYEVFSVIDGAIQESHPGVDERPLTAYSQSKVRAYRRVVDFSKANGVQLTSLHPAAVYGGLNTADGMTTFMDNLASWKWWKAPFVGPSSFPIIHIDSLVDVTIKSLDKPGAFIVSDLMTSLDAIAKEMRRQTRSYVPLVMPAAVVSLGVFLMEALAKVVPVKPLIAAVQLHFLTRGWAPSPAKAIKEIGWTPMSLEEGMRRFLAGRPVAAPASEGHWLTRPAMG